MKKVYTKPEIMFEDFTLSVNIAGDCEVKTNTPSRGNCAYEYNDEYAGTVVLFTSAVTACGAGDEVSEPYNGMCYHVPTSTNNLFNS